MDKKKNKDKIWRDGFPENWFIQDRGDGLALLIRERLHPLTGSVCICLKPAAIPVQDWLPTARFIAHGYEHQIKEYQNG